MPYLPKDSNDKDLFSSNLRNLIKAMLRVDPKNRANVNQVCECPLLKERIIKRLGQERYDAEFANDRDIGDVF